MEKEIERVFRRKFPVNCRSSLKNHFKIPGMFKPILGNESAVSLWRKRHFFFQNAQNAGAVFPPPGSTSTSTTTTTLHYTTLHCTTLHHTTSCGCAPVTAPSPGTCPRCPAVHRAKRPTCGSTSAQRCQPLHDPARTQRPRCHPEAHGHPRH